MNSKSSFRAKCRRVILRLKFKLMPGTFFLASFTMQCSVEATAFTCVTIIVITKLQVYAIDHWIDSLLHANWTSEIWSLKCLFESDMYIPITKSIVPLWNRLVKPVIFMRNNDFEVKFALFALTVNEIIPNLQNSPTITRINEYDGKLHHIISKILDNLLSICRYHYTHC